MTELYIDGYPVTLPDDFQIDYYVYNPFFTKKGEYTYDIDINLKDSSNAAIYKHINRMHVGDRPKSRKAILISNAKVIVSGTEIILSIEDDKVKIQIVSGNSELNYLSGGDKKIKGLSLGEISSLDNNIALSTLTSNLIYPDINFVCTPVIGKYNGQPSADNFSSNEVYNQLNLTIDTVQSYVYGVKLRVQPFILYYIDKVCETLGYSIISNVLLETEKYRRMIVVNGYETLKFNEMIPNWSVDEFISEIENLFNIIFVVDEFSKNIRIMNIFAYYENASYEYIQNNKVLDSKEKTFDVDESLDLLYNNVSYDLPSTDEYEYECLEDDLIELCQEIHVPSYSNLLTRDLPAEYNKLNLYVVDDLNLKFVLKKYKINGNNAYMFALVNQLKNVVDKNSDNETKFKIIPAETYMHYIKALGSGYEWWYVGAPVPYARNQPSTTDEETESNGMNEYIQSGVPEEKVDDRMFVSIYTGVKSIECSKLRPKDPYNFVYPYSITFPYMVFQHDTSSNGKDLRLIQVTSDLNFTLSLLGDEGLYASSYSKNMDVDIKTEYLIKYISLALNNSKAIFVIDNKKYYCKQLHYKILPKGIKEDVEGTFYPM